MQSLQTNDGLYAVRVRPVIVACSTAPPAQVIAINIMPDGCSLADGSGQVAGETSVVVRTTGPAVSEAESRQRHLSHTGSGQVTLRVHAALTTFKTLKSDNRSPVSPRDRDGVGHSVPSSYKSHSPRPAKGLPSRAATQRVPRSVQMPSAIQLPIHAGPAVRTTTQISPRLGPP